MMTRARFFGPALIVATLTVIAFAVKAHAAASPELQNYLTEQIETVDGAFASADAATAANAQPGVTNAGPEDGWWFRRIWLRIKPYATFTVEVASVKVAPEVELLWERNFPDGWTGYKPATGKP